MSHLNNQDALKAAVIIIGNEILSGRTQDTNTQWIAEKLTGNGISLVEVRVVPDIEEKIVAAVHALRSGVDYVFTTGGIGPTHDDITAGSIAAAFDLKLERNEDAYQMLLDNYGDVTPAQAKMAMIPEGAKLIPNPASGAPGFVVENVHVLAGVPGIMRSMMEHVVPTLKSGKVVLSNSVSCPLPESALAEALEALQARYEAIEIGSYPHFRDGSLGLSVVLRGVDEEALREATKELLQIIRDHGSEPGALGLQVAID